MKRFTLCAAVGLGLAQVLAATTADAAVREETVRCGGRPKIERAIEKALKKAGFGDEINILLVGTCKESPVIAVDNVTIQSKKKKKSKRAKIEGTINFVGARRGKVTKLKIQGKGSGVNVRDGAIVDVIDNDIQNNERNGIGVSSSSFARIINNRISNNGIISGLSDVGIDIVQSKVRSWGNIISGNGVAAVRVSGLGHFSSGNFVPSGRAVRDSDRDILIERGCTRGKEANTCGTSGTRALDVARSALADVRFGDFTGDTRVDSVSNILYSNSTVNGDISMNGVSRFSVSSTVSGSGTITCDATNNRSYGDVGCTGSIPAP